MTSCASTPTPTPASLDSSSDSPACASATSVGAVSAAVSAGAPPSPSPAASTAAAANAAKQTPPRFWEIIETIQDWENAEVQDRKMWAQLMADAAASARRVGVDEFLEEDYPGELFQIGWLDKNMPQMLSGHPLGNGEVFLDIWMETGVLWKDRMAVDNNLPMLAARKNPQKWMEALPSNRNWHLSVCAKTFFGANSPTACWLSARPPSEAEEKRRLAMPVELWPTEEPREVLEKTWKNERDFNELMRRARHNGLLKTLKANGREAAWLLNCLAFAPIELAREAREAGFGLAKAKKEDLKRFCRIMLNEWQGASVECAQDCGRHMIWQGQEPFKSRWLAACEEDGAELWERWSMAIEAGLPRLSSILPKTPDRPPQRFGSREEFVHHLRIDSHRNATGAVNTAIFAQEALRDAGCWGKMATEEWLRMATHAEWPQSVARLAGAKPGENALQWAIGRGFAKNGVSHDLAQSALFGVGLEAGGRRGLAALSELAQAGAALTGRDNGRHSLAARALTRASLKKDGSDKRAIDDLFALGADFSPVERYCWGAYSTESNVAHALFEGEQATTTAATALRLLQAMEKKKPRVLRRLLNERDAQGATTLHWAARAMSLEAVKFCVERGGGLNEPDFQGKTPLHWLAKRFGKKNEERLGALLDWAMTQKVEWTAQDRGGMSALGALAQKMPVDGIQKILELKPDCIDHRDAMGRTVLDLLQKRGGPALALAENIALARLIKAGGAAERADAQAAGEEKNEAEKGGAGERGRGKGKKSRRL